MRNVFEILADLGLPTPTGAFQVGASSGQEVDLFRANGISAAVFIEPLAAPFQHLVARIGTTSDYIAVNALCDEADREDVEFHVASNLGESSSLLKPARHLDDYPVVHFPEVVKLNCLTADRILNAIGTRNPSIPQRLNMLFMDVQGAELRVLKGASRLLANIDYIFTEVGLGGGYEGDVELIDLMHYLKAWGFSLYEMEIGLTGWGNAFFIKRKPGRR